jgi:clan AA aspartic protease (TIGR02281 family)
LFIVLVALSLFEPVQGQTSNRYYEAGVRCYQQKEYKKASECFTQSLRQDSSLGEALYYLGLSYYQMGREDKAREVYQMVLKNYPRTAIATRAGQALHTLDQADQAAESLLPRETWIGYRNSGHWLVVDGAVNDKATPMIFDTGAERSFFTMGQLRQLGIAPPSGPPTGVTMGVGASEGTPSWNLRVDLKAGRIERRNFPILVSSIPIDMPLLGQDFCQGYEIDIDHSKKAISFKLKGSSPTRVAVAAAPAMTVDSAGHYVHSVPFVKVGNSMIVKATINGNLTEMIFDTGADGSMFPAAVANRCGIRIDAGRGTFPVSGAGGSALARAGIIGSIKLGPVEKLSMPVAVCDAMALDKPLLGLDFLRDWHYTIDSQACEIRFTK